MADPHSKNGASHDELLPCSSQTLRDIWPQTQRKSSTPFRTTSLSHFPVSDVQPIGCDPCNLSGWLGFCVLAIFSSPGTLSFRVFSTSSMKFDVNHDGYSCWIGSTGSRRESGWRKTTSCIEAHGKQADHDLLKLRLKCDPTSYTTNAHTFLTTTASSPQIRPTPRLSTRKSHHATDQAKLWRPQLLRVIAPCIILQ